LQLGTIPVLDALAGEFMTLPTALKAQFIEKYAECVPFLTENDER
jgi:hypothetical protein